jgi:integrase/recombinase XerD
MNADWQLTPGKYLAPEELSALLRRADEMIVIAQSKGSMRMYRDAMIAITAVYLGLRRKELAGLNLADVEVGGRGENYVRVTNGKGGKQRVVNIGKDYKAKLVAYLKFRAERETLAADSPIFASQKSGRMSNSAVWRRWKKLVPDKPLHAARHTTGTMMFTATGNLRLVQRVLGHSKITTTQIYSDCLPSTMIAGVDQTEKLLRGIKRQPQILA